MLDCSGARAECWRAWVFRLGRLGLNDAVKAAAETGRPWHIVRDGFTRFSDHESPQTGLLLALSTKAKTTRLLAVLRGLRWFSAKEGRAELGGANISGMHGKSTSIVSVSPSTNAALGLRMLSEDEPESHVQTGHREEEKCGDERKFVNMMRENRSADKSLKDAERAEAKLRTENREKAVEESHWPRDLG